MPVFKTLPLIVLLLLSFTILSYQIDKPFIGHHDWNSVVYSNIARNYLRYGLLQTKLGQVRNHDQAPSQEFNFLTHYPPLFPLLIALSFKFFGISETSARLIPLTASLGMVFLIYLIGKELYSREVGFTAGILAAIVPLFVYFGKLPVHETVVPAFSLLSFWGYVKFVNTHQKKFALPIFAGLVLGGLINWTGYYIAIPTTLHYLHSSPKPIRGRFILTLIPLCIGLFILHLVHVKILTGSFFGGNLLQIFLDRLNPELTAHIYGFTLPKYLAQEFIYLRIFFTNAVFFLSLIYLALFSLPLITRRPTREKSYLILLLIYGSIHLLVFQQLVFIHDYMIYYLLPFMVLSAAVAFDKIIKLVRQPFIAKVILVGFLAYVAVERWPFTKALLDSNMNRKGYYAGTLIREHTDSQELAFISSMEYLVFYEVFVGFYADRNVSYGSSPQMQDMSMYRLILRPSVNDQIDPTFLSYLESRFPKHEDKNFLWYDTKESSKLGDLHTEQ